MASVDHRNSFLRVRLRPRVHHEFPIEPLNQPLILQLIADRHEFLVAGWIADVGKRRHDPMRPLPLRIDGAANLSVLAAALQQRGDERRVPDLIPQ
jgi:hypothetical protein